MGILTTALTNNHIKVDSSIGQGSNQIKIAGLHLVTIKEFVLLHEEKPRLYVKFMDVKDRKEISQSFFLISQGANNTTSVQNATAEFMINVVSLALGRQGLIFAGGPNSIDEMFVKSDLKTKADGTKVETFIIPSVVDKKIYIATHTQIGVMKKDGGTLPIEKQTIDPKYVFNANKLTKTEVASGIEEPGVFQTAEKEMNTKISFEKAEYKKHKECNVKYIQICSRLGISPTTGLIVNNSDKSSNTSTATTIEPDSSEY